MESAWNTHNRWYHQRLKQVGTSHFDFHGKVSNVLQKKTNASHIIKQ